MNAKSRQLRKHRLMLLSQVALTFGAMSKNFPVKYGVPQGSCLGPPLFVLYVSKLFEIVESHLPEVHAYADDTQLYISFKPDSENQSAAIEAMQKCIADIRRWMLSVRLKLNDDKTEVIISWPK